MRNCFYSEPGTIFPSMSKVVHDGRERRVLLVGSVLWWCLEFGRLLKLDGAQYKCKYSTPPSKTGSFYYFQTFQIDPKISSIHFVPGSAGHGGIGHSKVL